MVTNRNSVVLSLENHLFFSRMMKEHAIFLEVSFAGMNQHIAKEADRYKVQFEKILNHAINYKTSDIHILMKQKCSISFRQHGDLVLYDTFESHIGLKLFNYIL